MSQKNKTLSEVEEEKSMHPKMRDQSRGLVNWLAGVILECFKQPFT